MVALIIIGILVGIIVLINLIPVGVDLGYEQGNFHVSAKIAGILMQILPRPPEDPNAPKKEKKPIKEKKPKEKKPEEAAGEEGKKKRKLNFTFEEILELVRTVLKGLGRFGRKLKVDRFLLHYVAAGPDPYNTAMSYGYVNAALSSLAPQCRKRFAVKNSDVWTDVDFMAEKMTLDFGLAMTIRIGQIVGVGLSIGFGALKILLRNKRRLKREQKEAQQNGEIPDTNIVEIEIKKENTNQAEERMEANG